MRLTQAYYINLKQRKRIKKLQNTKPVKYSAWPISSQSANHCIGSIVGPENTPYENGIFYISISLLNCNYSLSLHIKFLTKIFHPNINAQNGEISSLKLKEAGDNLIKVMEALYSLLKVPDLENPENTEAKDCFINDITEFCKVASEWKNLYAL